MEATILHKMRLDKCDAYIAKERLGYRERKKRGTEVETNLQIAGALQ